MKNIRLYIDGQRADLDSSTTIPFTYQTSDAQMPTSVKNSYSKSVALPGTEANRRIFSGLAHMDSLVTDPQAKEPEIVDIVSETDAEFKTRSTPAEGAGKNRAKVTRVQGQSYVWNQMAKNIVIGNWSTESGVTQTISDGVSSIHNNNANYGIYSTGYNYTQNHKYYICATLKSASAVTVRIGYAAHGVYRNCSVPTGDSWTKFSSVVSGTNTVNNTRFYVYATSSNGNYDVKEIMLVDLTLLYGSGNEPTVAEFETMFPSSFYDYSAPRVQGNAATALRFEDAGGSALGTVTIPTNTATDSLSITWNQLRNPANAFSGSNSYMVSQNAEKISATTNPNSGTWWSIYYYGFSFSRLHTYLIKSDIELVSSVQSSWTAYYNIGGQSTPNNERVTVQAGQRASFVWIMTIPSTATDAQLTRFMLYGNKVANDATSVFNTYNLQIFDLTMMFGSGSEPSALIFEALFPEDYYDYDAGTATTKSVPAFPVGLNGIGTAYDELRETTATKRIGIRAYASGDESDSTVITDGTNTLYVLSTPVTYSLGTPMDEWSVSDESGKQTRLPQDTAAKPMPDLICDIDYGYYKVYPVPYMFNPMKRVPFLLYVDEMIVERGYCQLTSITRKSRSFTFTVGLFGGLGEFFYNLQTDSEGETRTLADLDFGADLGFKINATYVQTVWDSLIGGTLPDVAFVPMHNGVPKTIDADKVLITGGGIPASVTDGGNSYIAKDGYLLGSCERKYTEWEMHDLRSYLQRPCLRLKSFVDACCDPNNNGGWTVDLDSNFFSSSNPYYYNTYITLPQLNVEESTEDICDDGSITAMSDYPTTSTKVDTLTPVSSCMTIASNYIDMSSYASNSYLTLSVPVQLAVTGLASQGDLYLTNRVTHHTENKTICMMVAAYDDDGGLLAVSNRYVFTSKSHRNETGDLKKPSAPVATSDAQIDGYFTYVNGEYVFRMDENAANTFALTIDKIPRPTSTANKVILRFYLQMTTDGIPTLNKSRRGSNTYNVYVNNTQFDARILSGTNNSLRLVQPTQYASDSQVTQTALLNSLECSPLELLLSITKTFGLMWLQDNQENTVRLMQRTSFYTGQVSDIHDRIDYSKGVKVTPVTAESNNYILANEYEETDLSQAYESDFGRTYGDVRLSVGYDFGKDKIEMMDKVELQGYVDGALSGAGYWKYSNANGNLPPCISEGMKVTYYRDNGGVTETKDVDYNLFNVTAVQKYNSLPLGVACLNDDGEEKAVEVAPSLVFLVGGQVSGTYYLSDDLSAMATLNNNPCWIYDESRTAARIPKFARVGTFSSETYSLDFGTPKMTYYIPEVSLAPEQAIYARYWEKYLGDLLSKNTKKVECYVVFPPHLDMREEMRKFYLFDRSLWVLNKVTDYDATKVQPVKCEFIRVTDKEAYTSY